MQLHRLSPGEGARKNRKRVGRGIGSGHGKTAGRGTKGQLSRSGGGKGPAFEGGQTPIQRRTPKLPGFKNPFKKEFALVNVEQLKRFEKDSIVDPETMQGQGLIKKTTTPVKVLGDGEIDRSLTVKAHAFSATAEEKIKAAGGKTEVLS